MVSGKFELIWADVKKWMFNLALFSSPLLIMFLGALQNGKSIEEAIPLVYAALIQALIDLLRKFVNSNRY